MMEFYSGIATLGATMMYSFTKTNIFAKIIYLSIFLTSINYWRDPKHGFRRNLDMVCVCTGFLYQIFLIYNYRYYAQPYYICMCIGLTCYYLSNLYINDFPIISSYLHCCFHLFANLASIVLICQF